MNLVGFSVSSPVGPLRCPSTSSLSHAMASGATKAGSLMNVAELSALAQTVLVSRESCHVARIWKLPITVGSVLASSGLGLKKCVVSCLPFSSNKVACGVNSANATVVGLVGLHI